MKTVWILAYVLMSVGLVDAQMAVTTPGGTTNTVPVYTGSSTLGNSPISVSGNNVGIGNSSPSVPLDINGILHVTGNTSPSTGQQGAYLGWNALTGGTGETDLINSRGGGGGGFAFINGGGGSPNTNLMFLTGAGKLGIGTTTPTGLVDINGAPSAGGVVFAATNIDPNAYVLPDLANTGKMLIGWNRSGGNGEVDFISNRASGDAGGYGFYDYTNSGAVNSLMMLLANGNMGLGTAAPTARLEINGNVKLTSGSGASVTYPDGTVQSTAWNGVLSGGDYAESVDVLGDPHRYEPGDVMVIDAKSSKSFEKSFEPYSKRVSGIYSTKPGLTGRRVGAASNPSAVPMAIVGIVPTKVSTENGPIEAGDLLVTSSTVGYAMKGTDPARMMGAVIGKAIESLDSGKGVIEVLEILQ